MTRFNISLEEGVDLVFYSLEKSIGGEIFIPKIPSYNIMDIANAIAPNCKKKIVGIRPGEKLHEEMITVSDSLNTYDIGKYYVILPNNKNKIEVFLKKFKGKIVSENFSYNSRENTDFETTESLIEKIKTLNL